jgi:hypothetical protein
VDRYQPSAIEATVVADVDRLFAPWAVGRPPNYSPDPATKKLVALGYWLGEELTRLKCSAEARQIQLWKFNRLSRTYDIWVVAAECLNDVFDDKVEIGRIGLRRWG